MLEYVEERPFPAHGPAAFHDTVVMRFVAARDAPAQFWDDRPEPAPLTGGEEI